MKFENEFEKKLIIDVMSKAVWNNVNTNDADLILRARHLISSASMVEEKPLSKVVEAPTEPCKK